MRLNELAHARRAGFTLIELLVVISIVVVLLGVSVGAVMRFRQTAADRAADDQLKQLQIALRLQYDTVVRDCNKDKAVPDAVIAYADNDMDRARALHTAATLRVNFPDTFAEATAGVTVGPQTYPAKAAFKSCTGNPPPDVQAAALLYLVLMERSVGLGNSEVKATESVVNGFRVFKDPYGTPVQYYRWAQTPGGELDAPPYTPASAKSKDPLDPVNKVLTWSAPGNTTKQTEITNLRSALAFKGNNRVPSVVSFGKNKTNNSFGVDDRVGFRLDREGNQGK
ncbi:MAG: prepilin-type N-terminal cleavage/methylation domain-containing protein [Gemmata sp.]